VVSVLIGARNPYEISDAIELRGLDLPADLWDALAAVTARQG
jgi:hypothetical protein